MASHAVRRRIVHLVVLASCVGTFAACDEAVTGVTLTPTGGAQLIAVTPTQLLTQFGEFLPQIPIRVRVVDANGNPVPSATVHYNVLVGSGFFSADSTITSDQGFTEVTFVPTSAGTVVIEARFEQPSGTQRVQFTIFVLNDPSVATRFEKVSGDNQGGEVGTVLPSPLVVRLLNADGFPVANVPVTFAVQLSQGTTVPAGVSTNPSGPFVGQVVVLSDASGLAQVFARLGSGAGPHTFTAKAAVGPSGLEVTQTLTFNAQANASGRVTLLVPISGADQTAVIDTLHAPSDTVNFRGRDPQPLVLQAQDRFGNPVANAVISWFVSDGGGRLQFATTITDSQGVSVNRILDVSEGRNEVVAFASGADPIQFVITAEVFVPQEEEEPPPPPEEGGGG